VLLLLLLLLSRLCCLSGHHRRCTEPNGGYQQLCAICCLSSTGLALALVNRVAQHQEGLLLLMAVWPCHLSLSSKCSLVDCSAKSHVLSTYLNLILEVNCYRPLAP
jgi:hypothetical protein